MKKSIWKTTLTEDQKQDVINLYQSGKTNIAVLAAKYHVGVKQIMEILDNAGIQRKRNKKQIADGWKEGEKRPEYIMATFATESYINYLTETMALAGQMDGDATENFNALIQSNPFVGERRVTKKIKSKKIKII